MGDPFFKLPHYPLLTKEQKVNYVLRSFKTEGLKSWSAPLLQRLSH